MDKTSGKELAFAGAVGEALKKKRDYDGASRPSMPRRISMRTIRLYQFRGIAYAQKGDDDHALADYNLVPEDAPEFRQRV